METKMFRGMLGVVTSRDRTRPTVNARKILIAMTVIVDPVTTIAIVNWSHGLYT